MNNEIFKHLNMEAIIKDSDKNAKEISKGLSEGDFSKEDIASMQKELAKVELQAYRAKLALEVSILAKKSPDLSGKEVVIKMLSLLPEDISVDFLGDLAKLVVEKWIELKPEKITA